MVTIRRQLIADTKMKFAGKNPKTYLTIHETANPNRGANAAAHANLQSRQWPGASWHWTVDDKEAVQSYSHDFRLWHAGDGQGHGNMSSIAIETCVHEGNNWSQTKRNLVDLAVTIMQAEGIPLSRVVQHNHWSGKNCPTILRSNENREWAEIIAGIKAKLEGGTTPAPKPAPSKGKKSVAQMADEVMAGVHGNGHANRQRSLGVNASVYQQVRDEVNRRLYGTAPAAPAPAPAKKPAGKSVATMATEVINGHHGNGHANRQKSLGVNAATYAQVRAEVNRRVGGAPAKAPVRPAGKSIATMATEVIAGKHGNGHANRQRSLGVNAGTYAQVRAEVNRRV